MATDDITEAVATSMRDNNEPGVDIHEGGYFDAASDAIQAIEEAGYVLVPKP